MTGEFFDFLIPFYDLLLKRLHRGLIGGRFRSVFVFLRREGFDLPVLIGYLALKRFDRLRIGLFHAAELLQDHFTIKQVPHQTIYSLI